MSQVFLLYFSFLNITRCSASFLSSLNTLELCAPKDTSRHLIISVSGLLESTLPRMILLLNLSCQRRNCCWLVQAEQKFVEGCCATHGIAVVVAGVLRSDTRPLRSCGGLCARLPLAAGPCRASAWRPPMAISLFSLDLVSFPPEQFSDLRL